LSDGEYEPDKVDTVPFNSTGTGVARHIKFQQAGGYLCNANGTKSSINFEIFCDETKNTTPTFTDFKIDDSDVCNPLVTFTHKAGCPVANLNGFVAYVQENPWIIGGLLIVLGFIVTFYGSKFLPWVVAVLTGGATFLVVMLLCSVFGMLNYIDPTQDGGNIGLVILSFVLAIGLGVLVGFLLKKFLVVGFGILGFLAGFFLGNLLYNLVLVTFVQSSVVLFIVAFGLGAAGAYLTVKQKSELKIIVTALLGSYAFVRGISVFAGGYPNEITFYQQLNNGTAQFTPVFIGYLAGMVVVFVLGFIW